MSTPRLPETLVVVNVGLQDFADALDDQGVRVARVEWSPPHEVRPDLSRLLDRLG